MAERLRYPNLGHETLSIMTGQFPWREVRLKTASFFSYMLSFNVDDLPISLDWHWIH
jgi:hypothetical protein